MSDIAPDTITDVASASLAGQSGGVTQPGSAPAASPVVDPYDNSEVTSFDRAYVQKLRDEAAGRRTALKPYEDAFGGYEADDQKVWFDLAQLMKTDPAAAAAEFIRLGEGVKSQLNPPTVEAQAETEQPLTRADLERLLGEREQQATLQKETESILAKVTAAGFAAGTPEHREVLYLAAHETGGDLDAALKLQKDRERAVVDRYLTGKSGQRTPQVVTNQGGPAGTGTPVRTFADARAAAEARIAAGR